MNSGPKILLSPYQPWILKDEQSGLLTRIEATETTSSCVPMKN
jgi:hypothetical protein